MFKQKESFELSEIFIKKLRCISCRSGLNYCKDSKQFFCEHCASKYVVKFGIPSILNQTSEDQIWNSWDSEDHLRMGESYHKRASGELPEKEASKSYANLMKGRSLHTKGESLLDIGSACGHFYRSFHDRLDEDVNYTGVDITFNFLKKGRDLYKDNANVQFVHCNALILPFADDSFDTVIVNLFHFFPKLDIPLKEALRVAKKRVIWRTPLGEANYAIKTIWESKFDQLGVIEPNRDDYYYELCMIYTKEYLKGLVASLGGEIEFVEKDNDFQDFDNNSLDDFSLPSSKSVDGVQIAGSVILDWHYISILPK